MLVKYFAQVYALRDIYQYQDSTNLNSQFQVAKESADVIILDDNFSTILTVAKWGRSVYINIQKFVQFQLTVNIVALLVNFSSACLTGNNGICLSTNILNQCSSILCK